jgi:hypothetical protein
MSSEDPKGVRPNDWTGTDNSEQDSDAAEQAQTVAQEALNHRSETTQDSEKISSGDEPDGIQDLVDHINQMDSSGIIDMSAYRGEPNHDDDVEKYGRAAEVDDSESDSS